MPIIDLNIITDKPREINNDEFFLNVIKPTTNKKRALLVGQVQSGKTRAIERCISLAPNYYDAVIVFGGTNNLLNNQTQKRFKKSKIFSKQVEFFNSYRELSKVSSNAFWSKKIFPVIVILKAFDSLEKINDAFKDLILSNKRVLIIDDESDFASINNKKNGTSKIHSLIQNLLTITNHYTLLEVTATPFANILNKNYDNIYQLTPNPDYTGSKFFINNIQKYLIVNATKKKIIERDSTVWYSLMFWLISTAFYEIESGKPQKSEFLINIDLTTPTHEQVKKSIIDFIKWLSDYPRNLKEFEPAFKYFNIYDDIRKLVINKCKEIIKQLKRDSGESIVCLNSHEQNNYVSGKYKYSIVIGGTLISRGFTFEHLITELILNSPDEKPALDTMLQRARWFGYRHGKDEMQKYMTIFMNNKILETFKHADLAIDFFSKNYSFSDIKHRFIEFCKENLEKHKIVCTNKPTPKEK